jgi:hypothetical protein
VSAAARRVDGTARREGRKLMAADLKIVEQRAFPHPTPGSPHEIMSH